MHRVGRQFSQYVHARRAAGNSDAATAIEVSVDASLDSSTMRRRSRRRTLQTGSFAIWPQEAPDRSRSGSPVHQHAARAGARKKREAVVPLRQGTTPSRCPVALVFVAVRAFPQELASAKRERDAFSVGPVHDRSHLPLRASRFHFAASKVGRIAVDAVIAGPDMLIGAVGATV